MFPFLLYHLVENETSVEKAPREEKLSSEPLTKKAKIEVPVAQTFEISNTFRRGKKTVHLFQLLVKYRFENDFTFCDSGLLLYKLCVLCNWFCPKQIKALSISKQFLTSINFYVSNVKKVSLIKYELDYQRMLFLCLFNP